MESARRKVSDLYFRYKCTAISDKSDCYKAAALALMSVAEPVSHSTGVLPTVEDFMFATLWYALTSNSNTIDQVIKLGKKIRKGGPSHFENDKAMKGWGYAFPLLVSQQWDAALKHLASCGKTGLLLEAAHLSICISRAGCFSERSILDSKAETESGYSEFVGMILVNYSKGFQQIDPEAALEYLLCIPDETERIFSRKLNKNSRHHVSLDIEKIICLLLLKLIYAL